jgi:hypothetical protein
LHGGKAGPRPDNANAVKSGTWMREELAAVKAASAVGRSVRAIARNALARVEGTIGDDEGAAESARLWDALLNAQATQIEARKEKKRRLARKRRLQTRSDRYYRPQRVSFRRGGAGVHCVDCWRGTWDSKDAANLTAQGWRLSCKGR